MALSSTNRRKGKNTFMYEQWSPAIEQLFWSELLSIKLHQDKLDDSCRKVLGVYEIYPGELRQSPKHDEPVIPCPMRVLGTAFNPDDQTNVPNERFRAEGIIRNFNTMEQFKNFDSSAMLHQAGQKIWDAINDGTILSCPSLLASFIIIMFADIKHYMFTFDFAFPCLRYSGSWNLVTASRLTPRESGALVEIVDKWKEKVEDKHQFGFFLAKKSRESMQGDGTQKEGDETANNDKIWEIGLLGQYEQGFFSETPSDDRYICFADPSPYEESPGWPLRNLLVLIRHRWKLERVQILRYRDVHGSLILHVQAPESSAKFEIDTSLGPAPPERSRSTQMPKVSGWEMINDNGKVQKRQSYVVKLAESMRPERIADEAIDLNLQLFTWRLAPSIDLNVVKNTKCLLLGAGTLGSYVSRNLLGWGVRKVTFVDNGKVRFSNPVRQPLFEFKDCLDGGAPKAERAAKALKKIYPGVDSAGHVMSVPMAGHPVVDETETLADFKRLKALIDEHDAIFLLMDTRESRWLPTVMGKAAGKIVMNAALGFDTFVVMRHGLKASGPGEEELGCYFCNDVVAPADSLKDATLDQMCTVTRPGIAAIASALLVELLVSVVQHPLRAHAPAPTSSAPAAETRAFATPSSPGSSPSQPFEHPLGLVPHQIRGYLSTFSNLSIKGQPYDCCSACSDRIVERYKTEGWDFVKRALNEKGWVEEVSGLNEVQRRAEELERDGMVEWSDGEENGEGEGELI